MPFNLPSKNEDEEEEEENEKKVTNSQTDSTSTSNNKVYSKRKLFIILNNKSKKKQDIERYVCYITKANPISVELMDSKIGKWVIMFDFDLGK